MSVYTNFQSDNAKHTSNRSVYNPSVNPSVKAKGDKEEGQLHDNLDKYIEFLSWARFYPDLFLDLIKPKKGGINLHSDQRTFMRVAVRFYSMYGVFPRGWGKCVTGDTILFTNEGMKEIGSFFDYIKPESDYYTSPNISLLNRYGKFEDVSTGVANGLKKTKKLITEEGYEIQTSTNHPLLIMSADGDIAWIDSKDIQKGDYIVINRNNDVWGQEIKLAFNMDTFMDNLSNSSKSKIIKCNTPSTLTEGMALILGYLTGDGTMTQDNFVVFTTKDKDMLHNYKSFIENEIGLNVKQRSEIDFVVNGQYFREYLNQIGLKKVNAFNKEIPKIIMNAPKNIVSAFVRGLFDTDGGVSGSYLEFCTASEKLSKQLQTVLLNFGIISTRSKKYNKKYKTSSFIIKVYGKNVDIFKDEIGFSCERKQKQLIGICNIKRNPNKDIIPYQKGIIEKYYNDIKQYNKGLYDKIYHIIKGNNNLTYEKLNDLLNLNDASVSDEYEKIKKISERNYFYSKVETIEDGEDYVYDLSLWETHSFISNGFISHNTFNEVIVMYVLCVLYPGIEFSLTAQTKENAAELLKDKHLDITKKYPWFLNEIFEHRFSKSDSEVTFLNNSRIDILANNQGSKGQRRHAIMIEESALLDDFTFQDALYPIVEHGRLTVGELGVNNPEELSQKVSFFTTAGYRGSSEFERNMKMKDGMVNLSGEIILGSDWNLGCWYGRGSTKKQILKKKRDMSPIAFAQNYESKWVGSVSNALVDIKKVLKLRTLAKPVVIGDVKSEFYLSMDVARSYNTSNNQSSIVVLKVLRDEKTNRIYKIQVVNLIYVPNTLNFTAQAIIFKRIKYLYNAKVATCDLNGLGKGMFEELLKEHTDPITGQHYPCWDSINTEDKPDNPKDADKCLFGITSQGIQNDIIVNFIDMVESEKLELLVKHTETYNLDDKDYVEKVVNPMVQTDFLIEEISNIQLEHQNSGKLGIKQVTRRVDKDRLMAVMYGLYYIMKYENNIIQEEINTDMSSLLSVFKKPNIRA